MRRELLAQVQALPSLLSRVGDSASALGDAIELYQACVAFVCDRWGQPQTSPYPQTSPKAAPAPQTAPNSSRPSTLGTADAELSPLPMSP